MVFRQVIAVEPRTVGLRHPLQPLPVLLVQRNLPPPLLVVEDAELERHAPPRSRAPRIVWECTPSNLARAAGYLAPSAPENSISTCAASNRFLSLRRSSASTCQRAVGRASPATL